MSKQNTPVSTSQPLSRPARAVFWIAPPITVLLSLSFAPRTAALLPAVSLPTAYAIHRYHGIKPEKRGNFETCLWSFLFTGTAGMALAITGQFVLLYGFSYLFHGSNTLAFLTEAAKSSDDIPNATLVARAATAWTWQNVVQRLWFTYVVAGIWEESVKYLPIAYARRSGGQQNEYSYLHYALAAGLGFGAMENILFANSIVANNKSWLENATALAERLIVGTIGHVLATSMAGLRTMRSDLHARKRSDVDKKQIMSESKRSRIPTWRILLPSIFWHGTGNFVLMSLSAMNGHLGWVRPDDTKGLFVMYSLVGCVYAMSARQVWSEWRKVKSDVRA